MDGIKNLNLNVDVTVFAPENGNPEKLTPHIFRGRIFSENADQSVVIQVEDGAGSDILTTDKPIFLFLAHDLGLYVFSAVISNKSVEDGKNVINCSKPKQVKYFQRRNSVRVNVNIPAGYSPENDRSNIQYGFITDISMGGLQLWAPLSLPLNSDLELVFQLENSGQLYINGKVVRNVKKDGKYFLGISFTNPDEQTKDEIARFVMAEQVRQKRLGLQIFKAFIFNAHLQVNAPAIFCITKYKNLDVTVLQGKKCDGAVTEIGIHDLIIESHLKIPVGAELEFSVELPKLGYSIIRAVVKQVAAHRDKYRVQAEFSSDYEKIRDCILGQMARDFDLPRT